jgi:hypothetical protein
VLISAIAPAIPHRIVTLLPSMVHIHIVNIEGVFCKAPMCRGAVKDEDCNTLCMCVVEDLDCVFELTDQLGEIPPRVEALSGVGDLLCFKCG